MEKNKVSKRLPIILLSTGILLFCMLISIVNLFHFHYRMNSDLASDAILGKLIWDSRQIIPASWYVANEVRIICTPDIAALFYGLTGNMVLSEGLTCCLMTGVILFSIFSLFSAEGQDKRDWLLMVFLSLTLPFNYIILELLYLFASYYAIHTVILFFTLSIYVYLLRNRKAAPVLMTSGVIFALLLGMQGNRGILVIYGPLFGIEMIRLISKSYAGQKRNRADLMVGSWVYLLLVVSFAGSFFPFSVGQDVSRNIRKGFSKLVEVVLPDIIRATGLQGTGIPFAAKVCLLIFIVIMIAMLVQIIGKLLKKQGAEPMEWVFLVLCASPVVTALMVSFTTIESSERYYFVLIFAMAFSTVLAVRKMGKKGKLLIAMVCLVLTVTNIYSVYVPILKSEEPPRTEAYEVSCFLEEKGYTTAYATFENANMMTALANGRIQVAPVASVGKMDICKWLSSREWYPPAMPYDQSTAYVVTELERDEFDGFLSEHKGMVKEIGKIGKYYIFASDYNFAAQEES